MEFIDTHCHIHEASTKKSTDGSVASVWQRGGKTDPDTMIADAADLGVMRMVCVGTTLQDSELAVRFVQNRPNMLASIGIHPHEAKSHLDTESQVIFTQLAEESKVVAIGECGLDYFYNHSNIEDQKAVLRFQLELARERDLPLIFHVREAFDDFWPIFDTIYSNECPLRGVLHSFTDTITNLDKALARGLYIGLNGIMTFTKDQKQLEMARAVPINKLLLETDAPFLTPTPYRGTMCEPKHLVVTAEFLAKLRDENLVKIAHATTSNAKELFLIT